MKGPAGAVHRTRLPGVFRHPVKTAANILLLFICGFVLMRLITGLTSGEIQRQLAHFPEEARSVLSQAIAKKLNNEYAYYYMVSAVKAKIPPNASDDERWCVYTREFFRESAWAAHYFVTRVGAMWAVSDLEPAAADFLKVGCNNFDK